MMRAKRPRAPHGVSQSHGSGLGGHARTRSMSDDNLGDDYLLHMDPSLMTERQQLAFLLRKTAQEQSGGDSPGSHSSDNSSDDDQAAVRRPKKRIQHAKTSPRNARKPAANGHHQAKPSAPTPRARPAKSAAAAKTVAHHDAPAPALKTSPRGHAKPTKLSAKRLHVKTTASPTASDAEAFSPDAVAGVVLELDATASIRKPSPSSTSDIAHISVFDDALGHADFWSLHCALCSASASQLDASSEPLFLCQSCDKKYPTQRALGRV